ncbi:MAG: branched-chain-amino-acid transaminase [Planctomycetes bacterium]|nr:branched-chain-amino-acid transaminase [Planctomycetota bacterium]
MSEVIYIDGKLFPTAEAKINVLDHCVLYGDGVFEGIRVYGGRVFRLAEHVQRLYESAEGIWLKLPISQEEMCKIVTQTCEANKITDGYVRLIVTRGVGALGLDPRKCKEPSVICITGSIELYPEEFYQNGLGIITSKVPRTHPKSLNPLIKSCNYLNNILAKIEAIQAGVPEAIMLNHQGYVSECSGDNIFIIKDGVLKTPHPSAGILNGITRAEIIKLAQAEGIAVQEPELTPEDIYNADECFLTGTAAEVVPVIKVDERRIGNGKPGPITMKLLTAFHELVKQ